MAELNTLSATDMAAMIGRDEITSEELVRDCLARIEAREAEVGAWEFLDPDRAIAEARRRDRETARGPLHGIPIGVKDVIETADMPTAHGSPIHAGQIPANDAACVALAREAGAVILGKTVTTEFAAVTPGKTANPHDARRTPGGSSSGSAAAVADFMVPVALGTQTVGSVIRPASYCGAVGFKPSFGTFSLAGVKAQAESMDTLGFMTRCVADIGLVGAALLGVDRAFEAAALDTPPRIGVCRSPHWPQAEPATVTVLDRAVAALGGAGAELADVELPAAFDAVLDAQWTILMFEFARSLAHERTRHPDALSERLRGLLDRGMAVPYAEYAAALDLARRCRADIADVFERHDAILTPSAAGEAPVGLQTPSDLLFQRLWTVLHLPCVSLPGFTGEAGMPVGIQLVGGLGDESRLLGVARWVEGTIAGG